jgi:hypothetical protein
MTLQQKLLYAAHLIRANSPGSVGHNVDLTIWPSNKGAVFNLHNGGLEYGKGDDLEAVVDKVIEKKLAELETTITKTRNNAEAEINHLESLKTFPEEGN